MTPFVGRFFAAVLRTVLAQQPLNREAKNFAVQTINKVPQGSMKGPQSLHQQSAGPGLPVSIESLLVDFRWQGLLR